MSNTGIEDDPDVRAALAWLAEASGDSIDFWLRIERAQETYRRAVELEANRGHDLGLDDLGSDRVASYLAQASALLNDRRSYDLALGSRIVPFVKHLGAGADALRRMPGAAERANRLLRSRTVNPESAIFEFAVAVAYAHDGYAIEFIPEAPGTERRPDLSIKRGEFSAEVECKRLGRGSYEITESSRQRLLIDKLSVLIHHQQLSLHVDVTYARELSEVPADYLVDWVNEALECRILLPDGFSWKDHFGEGVVKPANLEAVRRDTATSSLLFGPKMARLLTGAPVGERGYNIVGIGEEDPRDVRFVERLDYGTVVTWECIAEASIDARARYIRSKLSEIDAQLRSSPAGIAHIGMDAERDTLAADLRRERNIEVVRQFVFKTKMLAAYLHYFVPRVTEVKSWMIDETPDRFGSGSWEPLSTGRIFRQSELLDNELAAWHQEPPAVPQSG